MVVGHADVVLFEIVNQQELKIAVARRTNAPYSVWRREGMERLECQQGSRITS
jgi:hypothetical protein